MYFRNYGLRNTCLDKCLECPVSDNLLTINMLDGPKHCCNLSDSISTIFIDNYQGN